MNSILLLIFLFIDESMLTNSHHKNNSKWINFKRKNLIHFVNDSHDRNAYANFQLNDRLIEAHNNNSKRTFKMSHNEFSHWVLYYYLYIIYFINLYILMNIY